MRNNPCGLQIRRQDWKPFRCAQAHQGAVANGGPHRFRDQWLGHLFLESVRVVQEVKGPRARSHIAIERAASGNRSSPRSTQWRLHRLQPSG